MFSNKRILTILCFLLVIYTRSHWAFDDEQDHHQHSTQHHPIPEDKKPLPKDKILLRDVKTLTFYRNKRTTSKRTHSINQLSCVGGTAGCRLFTPDSVECENIGFDHDKDKLNWRCRADISDRVRFNHVEVICEGYDYPEDDYILVGSCGLEFTLDYTDPLDYHHNSYFKHLDEHEKEKHHERVRARMESTQKARETGGGFIGSLTGNILLGFVFVILIVCSLIILRYISRSNQADSTSTKRKPVRVPSYGPLASAMMSTKKAC